MNIITIITRMCVCVCVSAYYDDVVSDPSIGSILHTQFLGTTGFF